MKKKFDQSLTPTSSILSQWPSIRYNAILHPLRPRMSHRHAIGWILLIWTLSSALAMPNAIYSTDVEDRLTNDNIAVTCTMIWPDGRYPLSSHDHIYNIVILVVTYLVPILTMAILYYKVGKELWSYETIGENIDKQQRAILAKKKIVKMMIVVVIIFALCWLPYHAFFVVNYYVPTIFQDVPLHYQRCYLFMYWLAMSNSMYNPIIIYFMNSNFRHEFKKILYLICCCRSYKSTIQKSSTTINNNQRYVHQSANSIIASKRDHTQPSNMSKRVSDCLRRKNHGEERGLAEAEPEVDIESNEERAKFLQTIDEDLLEAETRRKDDSRLIDVTTINSNNNNNNNNGNHIDSKECNDNAVDYDYAKGKVWI